MSCQGHKFYSRRTVFVFDDICKLTQLCRENGIYSRIVTNGYRAKTREHTDRVVSELKSNGLSQLRLSYSRWHQQHIKRENIVHAALSCQKQELSNNSAKVT